MTVLSSKAIDPKILEILRGAIVSGDVVKLTSERLDKKTYSDVNKVLEALGGKWNRKRGAHVFDGDPTVALDAVLGSGLAPIANPLAHFPTPGAVIDMMIEIVQAEMCVSELVLKILEPSAGEGAIVSAVREAWGPNHSITAVEIDPGRAAKIVGADEVLVGDFLLAQDSDAPIVGYDIVLMNPPFSQPGLQDVYVAHVRKAFQALKDDGLLVAVCPSGFTFGQNTKLKGFREFVDENGEYMELPDGAFKESGTGAKTVLVVLKKLGI